MTKLKPLIDQRHLSNGTQGVPLASHWLVSFSSLLMPKGYAWEPGMQLVWGRPSGLRFMLSKASNPVASFMLGITDFPFSWTPRVCCCDYVYNYSPLGCVGHCDTVVHLSRASPPCERSPSVPAGRSSSVRTPQSGHEISILFGEFILPEQSLWKRFLFIKCPLIPMLPWTTNPLPMPRREKTPLCVHILCPDPAWQC